MTTQSAKNRRGRLLIEPHFQQRFMARLAGWSTVSTLVTAGVIYALLAQADQKSSGQFFYVVQEAGAHADPLSRTQIVLPALAVSLVVNLGLTLLFALLYSQRLAGPVYRFKADMEKLVRGEPLKPVFHLRGGDEFQNVAHAFEALLKKLAEKGFLKQP